MDQGALVPDELTCDLVMDRIQQDDCKKGFVLDGFPRTIPQAECLDRGSEANWEVKLDYAIDVDVPDSNIVRRMSGRRLPQMWCYLSSVYMLHRRQKESL